MSTTVQDLEREVTSVPERAKGMQIASNEDYVAAGELLKVIKGLRHEVDQTFDPIISKQFEAHREAIAQKRKVEAPLAEAEGFLKPRIASWLTQQERIRRDEELRLQKLAQEEAERQQLENAVALDDIGETDTANAILEEKPLVVPIIASRTTPKVSGVNMTTRYSAQVISLQLLVKAVAEGKVPMMALQANQTFLSAQARAMKEQLNYPGVKLIVENNISAQ